MNICLVHGRHVFVEYFRSLGHTVLNFSPDTFFFNLPAALEESGFEPDMVLQLERLGRRTLVSGLNKLDCTKAFWSVDTHLNVFWHAWYGRLFDIVFTTQKAWIPKLRQGGVSQVEWLPWFGMPRPITPHPKRLRDIAFVGRITQQRPVRMWFAQFLENEYGVQAVEGLDFDTMLDFYGQSRVIPNETIFGEVNFRLFEGASCGCAVLNPNVSDEIAELFEPGVEVELFEHAADFKLHLERHLKDPMLSMRMGVAAWERVQRDHLARHRADRILALVPKAKRVSATGKEARKAFCLSLFSLWEAGRTDLEEEYLLGLLGEMGDDTDALGAKLRALAHMGRLEELEALLGHIMRLEISGNLMLDMLCSAACLRLGNWDMCKIFWYRYVETLGNKTAPRPETPAQLLRLWSRELQRNNAVMRVGFVLQEDSHLPVTASECLLSAMMQDNQDLRTHTRLAQVFSGIHGAEPARMGFLSHLALHEPDNWRISLDLALTHLQAFRLKDGLAELYTAREKAEQSGELDRLLRMLAARDRSRLLVDILVQ